MAPRSTRRTRGSTLNGRMIAMGIMLVILAGTFTAIVPAMTADQTARGIVTLNGHLRAS